MSRSIKDKKFREEWKLTKFEFERCAKLIKNYETRPLNDEERKERYKTEIINGYNEIVGYLKINLKDFKINSQDKLLEKIDNADAVLKNRLHILNFDVEFPPDRLDLLTEESTTQRKSSDAINSANVGAVVNDINLEFVDSDLGNLNDDDRIELTTENDNDQLNKKQSDTIGSSRITIQNDIISNQTNTNMEKTEFIKLLASSLRNNYAGDPLSLSSFVASIDFLKEMATTPDLLTLLKKFIITKLEGRAAEIVPENVESVEALEKILKDTFKHENSKVIEGRMMALRVDRAKFQDYAKQVEELSDALRRTLISDGMPQNLAERQVIDKTIELCRFNTQNTTVKSVLVSKQFENAKEVVAEFIIQSNAVRQEAQVMSLRKSQNGNFNNHRNFHQRNSNGRRNFRFFQNSNRSNRNFNDNRSRNNNGNANNGRDSGRDNGRDNGNRHFQRGRNSNRNIHVAENVTATQSTLGSAEE